MTITIAEHALLDARVFETVFTTPLGEVAAARSTSLAARLALASEAPFASTEEIRGHVRDLLRVTGYKPTGRGKPASEYLLRASGEGKLSSINFAVDACNVVSLHSGLPISVVDLDKAQPPFSIRAAQEGQTYVFNASEQTIDVAHLICLFDEDGPTANAVKDAQRTKTSPSTRRTLSVIWGTKSLPGYSAQVFDWYRSLLEPFVVTPW